LLETAELEPNHWFQSLAEVKDYLTRQGGLVQTPPGAD
jgi:hypothetical protein